MYFMPRVSCLRHSLYLLKLEGVYFNQQVNMIARVCEIVNVTWKKCFSIYRLMYLRTDVIIYTFSESFYIKTFCYRKKTIFLFVIFISMKAKISFL